MIALEFGVHKAVGAFTGDGIVIIFLPDAIIGTRGYGSSRHGTDHAPSTHAGALGFGI